MFVCLTFHMIRHPQGVVAKSESGWREGGRSLRSAAARAAQLQQGRQVYTPSAKYQLKNNADTTKLRKTEAEKFGAAPKQTRKGPGTFVHQRGNLVNKNNKFLQPWLFPIYPMIGMVAIGVGLGIMTAYRQLAINPGVLIDKTKRTDELPEVHNEEWAMKMSRRYAEDSPLRNISKESKVSPFGRNLDKDVEKYSTVTGKLGDKVFTSPVLPGDDNPVHGERGSRIVNGRPLGGYN